MSKKRTSKKQKRTIKLLSLVILILILALIIMGIYAYKKGSGGSENGNKDQPQGIVFPLALEDGKLEVQSVFQFSGTNPDCNYEEGENIAALQLLNCSDEHLKEAELKVILHDGKELVFKVTDLPAGKSVTCFEKSNQLLDMEAVCVKIECSAKLEERTSLLDEKVSVSVDDISVVLTNKTETELKNLVLHCHSLLDDGYFGGLTYQYPIESIPSGASVTVEATDCFLGGAEVVRISQEIEEQESGQASE